MGSPRIVSWRIVGPRRTRTVAQLGWARQWVPNAQFSTPMGKLYDQLKRISVLEGAWQSVRENARTSKSPSTRREASEFEGDASRRLRSIQHALSRNSFDFLPQVGIPAKKPGSSKRRPIVVAPIRNRIVQRAILDVLVHDVEAVRLVLQIPTSIGGIAGRGTRHAIFAVCNAIDNGAKFFIRSDIEGFFTKIPKSTIVAFIKENISDGLFTELFGNALSTELQNLHELGEHRSLFPIGDEGVAQGSALSTLAGNILLRNFDTSLNARGITCIRYIDDFILLGADEGKVQAAFRSARAQLAQFNMSAYSPSERKDKAEWGDVAKGFEFLGCQVKADGKIVQPTRDARAHLVQLIRECIEEGVKGIEDAIENNRAPTRRQRLAQTLLRIDGIISGWGHAYRFCNNLPTFISLDASVDNELRRLLGRYSTIVKGASDVARRRAVGVQLLQDIPSDQEVKIWR